MKTGRLVATHFNPDGKPKRGFKSQMEAVLFRNSTKGLKSKSTYLCTICQQWHIGKRRTRR